MAKLKLYEFKYEFFHKGSKYIPFYIDYIPYISYNNSIDGH